MRAYKVHHKDLGTRYVASEALARTARQSMFEAGSEISKVARKDITIDMVEIPTSKAELLEWLNKNFGA